VGKDESLLFSESGREKKPLSSASYSRKVAGEAERLVVHFNLGEGIGEGDEARQFLKIDKGKQQREYNHWLPGHKNALDCDTIFLASLPQH